MNTTRRTDGFASVTSVLKTQGEIVTKTGLGRILEPGKVLEVTLTKHRSLMNWLGRKGLMPTEALASPQAKL